MAARPRQVAWLSGIRAILSSYIALDEVALESASGLETLRLHAAMYCNDTSLARHAALAGMGVAYLPGWLVDEDIATGCLLRLLPDHRRPPLMLYATYSSRRYMTSKVRMFINFLSDVLAQPTPDHDNDTV